MEFSCLLFIHGNHCYTVKGLNPGVISKVEFDRSGERSQARIHTGFHRFTEIGQIFHKVS